MRLAARVVALVAATCGWLAGPGMPPAASSLPAAGSSLPAASSPAEASTAAPITLTSVTPSVLRPGETLTVAGTVDLTAIPALDTAATSTVRLSRGRTTLTTRSDVDEWAALAPVPSAGASGTTGPGGSTSGIELARQTLDSTAPRTAVPFTLTTADEIRLNRAFGVIPIAIDVVGPRGVRVATLHSFVGWHRSSDYAPLSLGWLLPVTLRADPRLHDPDPTTRTAAWAEQLGPGSRLDRLVQATGAAPVGYAVDPAVLGLPGRTPTQEARDPATVLRDAFGKTLKAAAASHAVFALPYADPDVEALLGPGLSEATKAGATSLLAEQVTTARRLTDGLLSTRGTIAWPADGALPDGREAGLRAAYGTNLTAVLVSSEVTDPTARLTPPVAGIAPLGTSVARWDDRLAALSARLRTPSDVVVATQELVAQTAALLGERPSIDRTVLIVPPRGFDDVVPSDVFRQFLTASTRIPWVRIVDADLAMRPGTGLDAAPSLPATPAAIPPGRGVSADRPGPSVPRGADSGGAAGSATVPPTVQKIVDQRAALRRLASLLEEGSPTFARWVDVPAQAASTRWRTADGARQDLVARLEMATSAAADGVTVAPQTTNFLADEGVLQVTVVNALDEPVRGVGAVLAPGNGRLVVVDSGARVSIAAHAKATISVRLAVLAQGLVPVTAWLTTSDGERFGAEQQLTVRAAPPGPWLYVALGGLFGAILLVGVIRAIRRPPRIRVDTEGLDPVDPTPEEPLLAPVERHTAP